MADYAAISRVAKILARATSPEENEAKTALDHAYKRMVRDGITLQDLLTLPESELFQDALVGLVKVILNNQTDLSPSAWRTAYAEYMNLITAKFSPAGQGSGAAGGGRTREEEARDYARRNGYGHTQGQSGDGADAQSSRGNDKTQKQKNDNSTNRNGDKSFFGVKMPKAMAQTFEFMQPWFQRGGVLSMQF